ncbi:MAG: hypothetical protein ACRC53_10810 [Plesiomonas sp.]|uniref:hypothetical protein n=1 Tax=Plesiomonas sp. TaxID=2486279 RepID=UPI003F3CECB0
MKDSLIALMLVALPMAAFASWSMNLHPHNKESVSTFQLQSEYIAESTGRGDPVVRTQR